jgi:hypothetical protein
MTFEPTARGFNDSPRILRILPRVRAADPTTGGDQRH